MKKTRYDSMREITCEIQRSKVYARLQERIIASRGQTAREREPLLRLAGELIAAWEVYND